MKHLAATGIVFVILVILITVARGANTPDWWTATSIPMDLRNIETAIWKSAEQRVDEREAAKAAAARRFLGYGYGCSYNNGHEYAVIPPFPPIDAFFKYPDSVTELLGGEANFMLVYGTKHIEFFALTIARMASRQMASRRKARRRHPMISPVKRTRGICNRS